MDKAVRVCRADRLLVKTLGIELAALNTRNLGAYQCGAVFEILRAIFRPRYDLLMVGNERLDRKSTRLNSSHSRASRMPSSA